MVFEKIVSDNFEQIIFCNDSSVGLKGIIAVHSTVLGPAVGGCRMWNYANEAEALTDVLRLSKGMTYKAAISGLNWGGGKSIMIGDPNTQKTPAMLARFGEMVDRLGGHYVTAKDVGIGAEDLKQMKTKTKHILGVQGESGSSGDPSPATAWGVYHGVKACVKKAFKTDSLNGIRVALQGLGSVSFGLIELLQKEGAKVIGCDIDQKRVEMAVQKYRIETVGIDAIYDVDCDVFSPSALGATINANTLGRIKGKIIAGAANNQLATIEDGKRVVEKGMIYAPDYAINAGGLINIYHEAAIPGGYQKERAFEHIERIGKTIEEILNRAEAERKPTAMITDHIVEERLAKARKANT